MLRVAADHFSHTDTGRARRANEDSYYARVPIFVVADGMGGAQAGEVASRLAVEVFEPPPPDGAASGEDLLAARVREANARIHAMSLSAQEHAGMGTTITAAHVGATDVAIAHVGDSRAYRLRGGELERLTEDHSLVEEMRRRGQLTAEEADEHPQRSIITRALGPEPDVLVDTSSWRGADGDVYLLCSDGLTTMVPEARVGEILRGAGSLRAAGRALVDAANEAGGRDNITVVLFRLEELRTAADDALEQPTTGGASAPVLTAGEVRAAVAGASVPPAGPGPSTAVGPVAAPAASPARGPVARSSPAPTRSPSPAPATADAPAAGGRGRRIAIVFALLALIVVPLSFGAYSAMRAVYFVGTNDEGFVTLYRGLPYSLPAGIDLYTVNYVSGVPLRSLPAARRARLVDHTLRSHDDASDLVRELERGRIAAS